MKKILLILIVSFILIGCVPLNEMTINEIIEANINNNVNIANQHRRGYKYFLPRGMNIVQVKDFNEVAKSNEGYYYLYFDLVSYFNEVRQEYKINPNAYFSMAINNGDSFGYLEINRLNEKYLIEIMYNYAKIEVIVGEKDIRQAVHNAVVILSTTRYNDKVLANFMGNNTLRFGEYEFNIFETRNNVESSYLTAIDAEGHSDDENNDTDLTS